MDKNESIKEMILEDKSEDNYRSEEAINKESKNVSISNSYEEKEYL